MAGRRYVATETFGINVNGEQITVAQGEVLNDKNVTAAAILKQLAKNDPKVKDFEDFGRFDKEDAPRPQQLPEVQVEQATAAPDEKRATATKRTTKGSKS
jgi:hypothetical protein